MSGFDYKYRHAIKDSPFGITERLFSLGHVVQTIGSRALEDAGVNQMEYLKRHASGDWGDLDPADKNTNDQAVKHGHMILSSYNLKGGGKLWIQTEWDRSVTTLMLPNER